MASDIPVSEMDLDYIEEEIFEMDVRIVQEYINSKEYGQDELSIRYKQFCVERCDRQEQEDFKAKCLVCNTKFLTVQALKEHDCIG